MLLRFALRFFLLALGALIVMVSCKDSTEESDAPWQSARQERELLLEIEVFGTDFDPVAQEPANAPTLAKEWELIDEIGMPGIAKVFTFARRPSGEVVEIALNDDGSMAVSGTSQCWLWDAETMIMPERGFPEDRNNALRTRRDVAIGDPVSRVLDAYGYSDATDRESGKPMGEFGYKCVPPDGFRAAELSFLYKEKRVWRIVYYVER